MLIRKEGQCQPWQRGNALHCIFTRCKFAQVRQCRRLQHGMLGRPVFGRHADYRRVIRLNRKLRQARGAPACIEMIKVRQVYVLIRVLTVNVRMRNRRHTL